MLQPIQRRTHTTAHLILQIETKLEKPVRTHGLVFPHNDKQLHSKRDNLHFMKRSICVTIK